MKKLLTLTAVGAILAAPAVAVQKCVALDSSTATCTPTVQRAGYADWTATCTTEETSVPIAGVAICSNLAGADGDTTTNPLKTVSSGTDTSNVHCWCKMVEPAVSSWVYASTSTSAPLCTSSCSLYCATHILSTPEYRSAMLDSLAN